MASTWASIQADRNNPRLSAEVVFSEPALNLSSFKVLVAKINGCRNNSSITSGPLKCRQYNPDNIFSLTKTVVDAYAGVFSLIAAKTQNLKFTSYGHRGIWVSVYPIPRETTSQIASTYAPSEVWAPLFILDAIRGHSRFKL
jgi:hypothetical protein